MKARERTVPYMPGYRDEDDWVGEPPEGRYTRERAKPEFWVNRGRLAWAVFAVPVLILIVILVLR
jgi:hypothetical protein